MSGIIVRPPTGLGGTLAPEDAERLRETLQHGRSENTKRAYEAAGKHWAAWCAQRGHCACPAEPEVLCAYLSDRMADGSAYNTVALALAAISVFHRTQGFDPIGKHWKVRETMASLRRQYPGKRAHPKAAITVDVLQRMVESLPPNKRGARDRALILLGFAGAFRRSELVALQVKNLDWVDGGLAVWVERSKTDQESLGAWVRIGSDGSLFDPVVAVRHWLDLAEINDGPVFRPIHRSGAVFPRAMVPQVVIDVVLKALKAADLDPTLYGAHSLRAGFVTECFQQGVGLDKIMAVTRHKSVAVAMGYNRPADPAVTGVGVTVRLGERKP